MGRFGPSRAFGQEGQEVRGDLAGLEGERRLVLVAVRVRPRSSPSRMPVSSRVTTTSPVLRQDPAWAASRSLPSASGSSIGFAFDPWGRRVRPSCAPRPRAAPGARRVVARRGWREPLPGGGFEPLDVPGEAGRRDPWALPDVYAGAHLFEIRSDPSQRTLADGGHLGGLLKGKRPSRSQVDGRHRTHATAATARRVCGSISPWASPLRSRASALRAACFGRRARRRLSRRCLSLTFASGGGLGEREGGAIASPQCFLMRLESLKKPG